jgi:hypothetical protein
MVIAFKLQCIVHPSLNVYLQRAYLKKKAKSVCEIRSLQDLICSFDSIQSHAVRNQPAVISVNRLAPKLKFVDDFSAALALCFGANVAITATVWGSIRLILMQASTAIDTFQNALDMLEELSLTLAKFQVYEEILPLSRPLQTALVDVYTETICFYARAIHFFRDNPHDILRRKAWPLFQNDLTRTVMRLKRMSAAVESDVDLLRMRREEVNYQEILTLMDALRTSRAEESQGFK